jgi:glucokinase
LTRGSLLIGDLGATNARIALADPDKPGYTDELVFKCADHDSPLAVIEKYLQESGASQPSSICLAVAAPVVTDEVRFVNNDWRLSVRGLRDRFSPAPVLVVNDFKAAAYAIPVLGDNDLLRIGDCEFQLDSSRDFSVAMIGPGTGLGVSGLMQEDGRLQAVSGEGGHQGFSPHSGEQQRIFDNLRQHYGRVSAERILSGPGIENIYRALQEITGQPVAELSAADIFRRAGDQADEIASRTEAVFYEILGQVAGDLALITGAWDGVFIGGGIVPRYPQRFLSSRFRAGFENKGRHRALMENIPTCLVTHSNPGLLGASQLVRTL